MLSCVFRGSLKVIGMLALVACVVSTTLAQTVRLEVTVDDFEHFGPLPPYGNLPVFITNHVDTVAGFVLWLQLDRPDIIRFLPATPPEYQVDTANGSVINGWELLTVRSVGGGGADVRIVALAEFDFSAPHQRGFEPSSSPRRLLSIPYEILPGTDTMTNPTVNVLIKSNMSFGFDFSTPQGTTIPWADTVGGMAVLDTNKIKARPGAVHVGHTTCFADGDLNTDGIVLTVADCVYGMKVIAGMLDAPDSLYHYDFNADCVMDKVDAQIYEDYFVIGLPVFLPWPYPHPTCCNVGLTLCCQGNSGNVDCDPSDGVDISDISALIDYLYISFSPLCCWGEANIDGDTGRNVDIADLSAIIDFLYVSYTPPAPCF